MHGQSFERALLLVQQERYALAEQELRRSLSDDSQNGFAHALLAQCLAQQKRLDSALTEAKSGVHLSPDSAYCHFVLADVHYYADRHADAQTAIQEALQLDPDHAGYHSLHAAILLARQKPELALQAVRRGLQIDPEDTVCVNVHALVLRQLGRTRETEAFAAESLARSPENPFMHAAQGWNLLEHGDPRRAAEHFREALRLDPDLEYARLGLLEAMKSRFAPYRWIVLYSLWTSRMTTGQNVAFVVGLVLAMKFIGKLGDQSPAMAMLALPLIGLYLVFVYITWTAGPLSNVLLRLHPMGRHALTSEERWASTFTGIALGLAIVALLAMPLLGLSLSLTAAGVLATAVIPISAAYALEGGRRIAMGAFCIALVMIGIGAILVESRAISGPIQAGNPWLGYYLIGLLACTWITAALRVGAK